MEEDAAEGVRTRRSVRARNGFSGAGGDEVEEREGGALGARNGNVVNTNAVSAMFACVPFLS